MKYHYTQTTYSGRKTRYEINLPNDIVFLHDPKEIGPILYSGAHHYLGVSKDVNFNVNKNIMNGVRINKDWPGIVFYSFNNCKIEEDIPLITGEDFYKQYELDTYYILHYSINYREKKLFAIDKILDFNTQYNARLFSVSIAPWVACSDAEVKMINVRQCDDIIRYSQYDEFDNIVQNVVMRYQEDLFKECMNTVLGTGNYKV